MGVRKLHQQGPGVWALNLKHLPEGDALGELIRFDLFRDEHNGPIIMGKAYEGMAHASLSPLQLTEASAMLRAAAQNLDSLAACRLIGVKGYENQLAAKRLERGECRELFEYLGTGSASDDE